MSRSTAALLASLLLTGALLAPGCSDNTTSSSQGHGCGPTETYNPLKGVCEAAAPSGRDTGVGMADGGGLPDAGASDTGNSNGGGADAGSHDLGFDQAELVFRYTSLLESSSQQVTLHNGTDSEVSVSSVDIGGDAAEFSLSGLAGGDTVAPHASVAVSVQFTPQDTTDDHATLRVHSGGQVVAQVTLTSQLRQQSSGNQCDGECPKIQVSPTNLNFSYQPGGSPQTQQVYVGNVGDAPLTLYNVLAVQQGNNFAVGSITTPQDIQPQQNIAIPVTFTPGNPQYDSAHIVIQSSDPWDAEVQVPVSAASKGQDPMTPCINVTPTTLDYGHMTRGNEATKTFQISNCGESDLTVQSIDRGSFFGIPTPRSFQITQQPNMPATLSPGQTESVDIRYRPGTAGPERGFFTVKSDADTPSVRVNVTAYSDMPPRDTQDISIELDWDSDNCDVDSHLIRLPPDRMWCDNDCFFSNRNPDWGAQGDWEDDPFLDTDDVDGYGPEHVNLQRAESLTYKYVIHYWRDSYDNSMSTDTNATVKLYIRGTLVQTFGPYHLQSTGDTVAVFTLDWPSQNVTELGTSYSTPSSVSCP